MASAYRFGEFVLDSDTRELLRDGETLHISPKAFQLLELLVRNAPRALSKSELQDLLWPDSFVVEANLQHLVGQIRSALGDDPKTARFVRTIHGFGYAFRDQPTPTSEKSRACLVCRLRWEGGRVTLAEGEHLLGRDPELDVVLDSATVSRRHARIRIHNREVTLEDLGSKNGSFLHGQRVEAPVRLADGDRIRFGHVPVSVRLYSKVASTASSVEL
jgi:DNA-binding winged helix-turn-helix (wHTH) protein